jgi:hypothetical protein
VVRPDRCSLNACPAPRMLSDLQSSVARHATVVMQMLRSKMWLPLCACALQVNCAPCSWQTQASAAAPLARSAAARSSSLGQTTVGTLLCCSQMPIQMLAICQVIHTEAVLTLVSYS